MRKLITITILSIALTTAAFAAPQNDSSDRDMGPITRIINAIKKVIGIRPMDTGWPVPPIPSTTT
jgi:hypothetical protein